MRPVSPAEALVVVTFDSWPVPVRLLLDLLEFIGSWADVGELEMDGPRMLRFRVPREQMLTVILALDCHRVTHVKAYEIYPARPRFQDSASDTGSEMQDTITITDPPADSPGGAQLTLTKRGTLGVPGGWRGTRDSPEGVRPRRAAPSDSFF